jgi:hypothetical protein
MHKYFCMCLSLRVHACMYERDVRMAATACCLARCMYMYFHMYVYVFSYVCIFTCMYMYFRMYDRDIRMNILLRHVVSLYTYENVGIAV